jgi:glycosyltransferase involved in cell wall biosynthesis
MRPTRPLRIIGLITHDGHGGAQTAMFRLCEGLRQRGHMAQTLCLYGVAGGMAGASPPMTQVLMAEGCRSALDYARLPYLLWRYLRSERPDAVLSFLPLANGLGQLVAWSAGVRGRIASQRNPLWTYHGAMRVLDVFAGTLGAYRCIVCVSEAVHRSCSRLPRPYRRRLMVIHNGVAFEPSPLEPAAARRRLGLPQTMPLIGALGRLTPQKNPGMLLDVLAGLPAAGLALAGDGELADVLRQQASQLGISGRVFMLGRLAPEQVRAFLRSLDVFVQPSLFEGQSNALLEAMASGIAIAASDIPAQRETLTSGAGVEAGVLLPPDEPLAWRTAIDGLLRDPDRRRYLGEAAMHRSQAFLLNAMVDRFERITLQTIMG